MLREPMLEAIFEVPHTRKHEEGENGGENRHRIQPESDGDTHACGNPEARCGGRAMHRISTKDDNTASEKSDAHDDSRSGAHRVQTYGGEICGVDVITRDDKEARSQSHQAEGARTGGLFGENRPFGAYHPAENNREQ